MAGDEVMPGRSVVPMEDLRSSPHWGGASVRSDGAGCELVTAPARWSYAAEIPLCLDGVTGDDLVWLWVPLTVREGAFGISIETADKSLRHERTVAAGDGDGPWAIGFDPRERPRALLFRNVAAGDIRSVAKLRPIEAEMMPRPTLPPAPAHCFFPYGNSQARIGHAVGTPAAVDMINGLATDLRAARPILAICQNPALAARINRSACEVISYDDIPQKGVRTVVLLDEAGEREVEDVLRHCAWRQSHSLDLYDGYRRSDIVSSFETMSYRGVELCFYPTVLRPTYFSDWQYINHLLDTVIRERALDILDMFAGSGVIGLALKREAPRCRVDFSDINFWSVRSIRQSIAHNPALAGGRVWLSEGMDNIPPMECFDLIVGNPPHHAEKPLASPDHLPGADPDWVAHHQFFAKAHLYLKPGGRIVFIESAFSSSFDEVYRPLTAHFPQYSEPIIVPLHNNMAYYIVEIGAVSKN